MNKPGLLVRGIHGGVLITLPDAPWYQQRDLLVGRIQTQERFFKGGRIALDVGLTEWSEDQLLKLLKDLADEGVCLWTILSGSEKTRQAAEYHGFFTSLPDPNRKITETPAIPLEEEGELECFACLPRSLSESEVFQHDGDLLLIGNVPPKAQLEVTGTLLLWGTLQGIAKITSAEERTTTIRLLRIENGRLLLDDQEMEIPPRLQKHNGLVITKDQNGIDISSLKPGRLL